MTVEMGKKKTISGYPPSHILDEAEEAGEERGFLEFGVFFAIIGAADGFFLFSPLHLVLPFSFVAFLPHLAARANHRITNQAGWDKTLRFVHFVPSVFWTKRISARIIVR